MKPLTSRETEAIMHMMQGTKMSLTAKRMACGERTVRFHLDNARRKLKATTQAHLVALFLTAEMQKREAV